MCVIFEEKAEKDCESKIELYVFYVFWGHKAAVKEKQGLNCKV